MTEDDLRYPVGRFEYAGPSDDTQRRASIETIAEAPARMREVVRGLTDAQLDTPYRDGGWTLRQVVHHVPDSHMNGYVRTKLALTEDAPTIKPYDESLWARLADVQGAPIEPALTLLGAVHDRWVRLLHTIKSEEWPRTYFHPEHGKKFTIDQILALYAWHSRHHVAHVTSLRKRKGW